MVHEIKGIEERGDSKQTDTLIEAPPLSLPNPGTIYLSVLP